MATSIDPKITVIIATYNSSHTLQYTIKSVLNQSFRDFEVWIIGDCCTDNTEKVIASLNDSRLKWFNRIRNSGSQPAPNNEGIKRAKGEYIAYVGHDDLWLPNHLEQLLSHSEKFNLEFTYSITLLVSQTGIEQVRGKTFAGIPTARFVTPPSSWMHKKVLVERVGYWSENYLELSTAPDQDFYSRSLSNQERVNPLKKLTVIKFHSVIWKSYKNKEALTKEIKKFWLKIATNPDQLERELLSDMVFELSQFNLNGMILPFNICYRMMKQHLKNYFKRYLMKVSYFRDFIKKRRHRNYLLNRMKTLKERGLS